MNSPPRSAISAQRLNSKIDHRKQGLDDILECVQYSAHKESCITKTAHKLTAQSITGNIVFPLSYQLGIPLANKEPHQ